MSRRIPTELRFWPKVRQSGDCWEWTGSRDTAGYGVTTSNGRAVKAHRWAYVHMVGEIPEGLHLDHLCRNRACVNPYHLDPVPRRINILRGIAPSAQNAQRSSCVHGHELTPENTRIRKDGSRFCRACGRRRMAEMRARQKCACHVVYQESDVLLC